MTKVSKVDGVNCQWTGAEGSLAQIPDRPPLEILGIRKLCIKREKTPIHYYLSQLIFFTVRPSLSERYWIPDNIQIPRQILHKVKNRPKLIATDLILILSILNVLTAIIRKLDWQLMRIFALHFNYLCTQTTDAQWKLFFI